MRIALVGPPGSGKSTIIEEMRLLGINALDVEKAGLGHDPGLDGATARRDSAWQGAQAIGAADLDIDEVREAGFTVVFLSLGQEAYAARRAYRDAQDPTGYKKLQPIHAMQDWSSVLAGTAHMRIDADRPLQEVVGELVDLVRTGEASSLTSPREEDSLASESEPIRIMVPLGPALLSAVVDGMEGGQGRILVFMHADEQLEGSLRELGAVESSVDDLAEAGPGVWYVPVPGGFDPSQDVGVLGPGDMVIITVHDDVADEAGDGSE